MKRAQEVANFDPVALIERQPVRDRLVIHEGAITALKVFDVVLALNVQNLGVIAADGRAADRHLTVRIPTENDGVVRQLNPLSRIGPFEHKQRCHVNP